MSKFAISILIFLFALACLGPFISPYSYSEIHLEHKNTPPSLTHWFGSDDLGRDIFTRVCWGARISLFVGVMAAIIDMFVGALWGSFAAYTGGKTEELMMRLCDIFNAIPSLLIAMILTVVRGSGIATLLIAMTLTGWINMARICRSQILQLKQNDYISAATALGAKRGRILFKHLIPNALGPIIVTTTLTIPSAIFTEAFLSFFGLGIQAPAASLGSMVNEALSAMFYYPWRLFFPAFFITLITAAFHWLGGSLRDKWDPKTV